MDIEKLARMANQIAANLDYGPDKDSVAEATADHLRRFWSSSMRAAIIDAHARSVIELSPIAARAVETLAAEARQKQSA
jgi:formate dehydrogenase subunit delta